jgi:hypothetical protein
MPDNIVKSARLCAVSVLLLGSTGATPFLPLPQLRCPRVPKHQTLRPDCLCAGIRCCFFTPPLQIPLIHLPFEGLPHLSQAKAGMLSLFPLQIAVLSSNLPQRCDAARPHCATCVKYVAPGSVANAPDLTLRQAMACPDQRTPTAGIRVSPLPVFCCIDPTVTSPVVTLPNLNVRMIPWRVYLWHRMPIP